MFSVRKVKVVGLVYGGEVHSVGGHRRSSLLVE